jgi:capsular exopolysaccharide synthesis family protein
MLNMKGLTDALVGRFSLEEVTYQTGIEGLKIIPCGPKPPNPSEMLSSQKMKAVIKQLSQENECVIFDTPPVVSVTDAAILSSHADGVILVVDSRASARHLVIRAKQQLELAKAKILGVVLGKVSKDSKGYYYYYYYYHE